LLIHVDNAYHIGKKCEKLKELIPVSSLIFQFKPQLGEGNFRETIKALRKDVTVTVVIFRKRKLLEKQKKRKTHETS
jgi:translation elongation factor EF-4